MANGGEIDKCVLKRRDGIMTDFEREAMELINRRRRQVLVHSCIYYRLGESVIEDRTFDGWAYQLASLQETYPEIAEKCVYADEFRGFDGTTGFHLPLGDPWVVNKAHYILEINKKEDQKKALATV